MLKHRSISAILSATALISTIALVGCDQSPQKNEQTQQSTELEQNISSSTEQKPLSNIVEEQSLSHGNMFNIIRDVAQLQLKTDDYTALLQNSQSQLEQAIQNQNVQQLKESTAKLKQELHALHDVLLSLQLKSTEVDQIRQSLLSANQQLLNLPLLHGQQDISQLDFEKIAAQFNKIQVDMLKLATLVLGSSTSEADHSS
ncbi:hypothetical protein F2A31_14850 [Acinetobacter suaedae]|uniref:Lipoprotein n=1 Tax=Acinetobacter suaedae TaxID=2609668 RepID=A0A5P1V0F7_9GAMM|nr:hypothetical protein [Acinetobacter sp. C16S1]QER40906.1 hypothetical protein F2A31_14850 [Acinetobacter sp. C16S1]